MITIRKLLTLKESTRHRKMVAVLKELEGEISRDKTLNTTYIKELLDIINRDFNNARIKELSNSPLSLRSINSIRHIIMGSLSMEPSEWDFYSPEDGEGEREILPISIYLDDLRSPFNIGSLFRTSECFGIEKVLLSKDTTSPEHKRAIRTSMGCIERVEWQVIDPSKIEGPIFALELGGTPIDEFEFPKKGTVIIGSEELGVSPENLKLCDSSFGRVTIPLYGNKSSLNVASATAILLQRWSEYLKRSKK